MANVLSLTVIVALLLMSVAHAQSTRPITWAKWCDTITVQDKEVKEGKEARREADICMTYHSRIDGNLSTVLPGTVSFASLDQITTDRQHKQRFRVAVRSGASAYTSIRLTIVPRHLWEKAQQKDGRIEKNDGATLETFTLLASCGPAFCRDKAKNAPECPSICTAQVDATPGFLTNLKNSGGFIVHATGESGAMVTSSVALAGFAEGLAGEPYNWRELLRARKRIPQKKTMKCDEADWPGCKLP